MKRYILYSIFGLAFVVLASFNVMRVSNTEVLIGTGFADPNYNVTLNNSQDRRSALIVNNNTTVTSGGANAIYANQKVINSGQSVGVRARAYSLTSLSSAHTFGVHASAGNGQSGYNFGVYAELDGSGGGAAVFAQDKSSFTWYGAIPNRYAGFFMGNVYISELLGIGRLSPSYVLDVSGTIRCSNVVTTSDSNIKTNVQGLKSSMELIEKLRPVTYNFKPDDYSEYYEILQISNILDSVVINNDDDLRKYFSLGEPRDVKRKHIGFLAQELKEVIPELVYEDKKGSLSIDYISLIPVLVGTIQELNQNIQELSKRLDALENKNGSESNFQANSAKINSFLIYPNPANNFVTIDYTLLDDALTSVELFNTFGQRAILISPFQNQRAGAYSVQASLSGLSAGAYVVRVTAGNQIESKQLIIN